MKIGYVLDRFPSLHQTFILREMLELERRGFSIVVFSVQQPAQLVHPETQELNAPVVYAPELSHPFDHLGGHVQRFAEKPGQYVQSLLDAARTRQRIVLSSWHRAVAFTPHVAAYGIDHLHAHFAVGANVVAMYLSEFTGRPFSFTTHAVGLFARPVLLCRTHHAARFAVTVSEYNRTFIAETCGAAVGEKLAVIYASVDVERIKPSATVRAPTVLRILSVGRLVEKKGHRYLVEALDQLRAADYTFECVIVGDGPERERLLRLIADRGLGDRVKLLGALTQDVVRELYTESDIFVLPCVIAADGDRDGIPVSLMEAMAAGLPVVSTTVSGIPELISNGHDGVLTKPKDVPSLASALSHLLRNDAARQRLGHAAHQRILGEFDVRRSVAALDSLFTQGVGGTLPCVIK